jgi:hypothetical protein
VYTDSPEQFADICGEVNHVSPETLAAWKGPRDYAFRPKLVFLAEDLRRHGQRIVYVDGDTFFLQSPSRLFERIGEQRAVMHCLEDDVPAEMLRELQSSMSDASGPPLPAIWNAGVIGVQASHAGALEEALRICDDIYGTREVFTAEQYAIGCALARHGAIATAQDVVYHYCHPVLKKSFQAQYARLARIAPLSEQIRQSFAFRPRWDAPNAVKIAVKSALRRAGVWKRPLRFELT